MPNITDESTVYVKHTIDVLKQQGVAVSALLSRCDIDEAALNDGQSHISQQQYAQFFNEVITHVAIPGLGLLEGLDVNRVDHGILGYAMYASATVGKAFERHSKYQDIIGAVLKTKLIIEGDTAHLRVVEMARPEMTDTKEKLRYQTEQLFSIWNQHGPAFGESKHWFSRVDLSYPAPEYVEMYDQHFKCPVHFDQPFQQVSFAAAVLDQKLLVANEEAAVICDRQCSALLQELKETQGVVGEIRQLLAQNPGNYLCITAAAARLAMSERTLRRHLAKEGVTYKQVILDFRMEIAASCVRNKAVPLNEAGYASGYTEQANFHRAFSKYFGSTPKQYRLMNNAQPEQSRLD